MLASRKPKGTAKPLADHAEHAPGSLDGKSRPKPNPEWQSLALRTTAIQPKLTVSQPGDPYEQEADRVAEQVMRMSEPKAVSIEQGEGRKPTTKQVIQPKSVDDQSTTVSSDLALHIQSLRGSGQPLDTTSRAILEPRFGHDFGQVRLHTDAQAAQSAREINAAAYTVGDDVVFGPGRHTPDTDDGRHLLAHELTHVIQQRGKREHSSLLQRQVESHGTTGPNSSPVVKEEPNKEGKLHDGDEGKGEKITIGKEVDQKAEETKSITLSRGLLQMASEGDFTESDTSVKKPCFPFNVNVFQKLTEVEIKTYDDAKKGYDEEKKKNPKKEAFKKPYQRYGTPDANGVFKKDDAGSYKMGARKDRHSTTTYTTALATDQQMGTTNNSGVTIGFGIDLGNRYSTAAEAKKDFKAAGIIDDKGAGVDGNKADKLLDAVGLKGIKAAEKAANLRNDGVTLTVDQVLKLLDVVIPSYDKKAYTKGYSRGDCTLDPAIEEVLMAFSYWGGNAQVRTAIIKDAKDKKGAEQFRAAAKAVKDNKSSDEWMQRGYRIYISYLELLAEIKDSGYEIKMSDSVSDKDTLTGTKKDATDNTLQFVKDLSERAENYKTAGKDLKKQMSGTGLASLIANKVGESKEAKNNEVDVKVIQQLLSNGNYDVEVTGKYDDKTKTAIQKFTKDEFGTSSDTIDPGGQTLRHMKKFQYLKRST